MRIANSVFGYIYRRADNLHNPASAPPISAVPEPKVRFMSPPYATRPASTVLEQALDQTESVKDRVEQSASELLVNNAVLKQEIPAHLQTDEVAQVLEKNDALEVQVHEAAEDLVEVNKLLEQEIVERERLERELQAARAKLSSPEKDA